MKRLGKIIVIVLIVFVLINGIGTGIWIANYKGYFNKGNKKQYAPEKVEALSDSPLKGMNIAFLGSSVTEGARSKGVSFVEYLAKRNQFTYEKEAVSGTKLVDDGKSSYVERLSNFDKNAKFDLVIVQLSTNDAGDNASACGTVSSSYDRDTFDTSTVSGAIEYIISYCRETWNCPVVFYTGTKNSKNGYEDMVKILYQIKDKWGIGVIDLWSELKTDIPEYKLYMADEIHPTQAGYLEWWTPQMEKDLYEFLGK